MELCKKKAQSAGKYIRVNMITIRNAPSENRQSTSELVIFASGNINFDTYVFLSSDELSVILPSALPHAPITNSYSIRPAKRYTGKCGIDLLNILENTITITIMMSNGFRILHTYPRKLLLYFNFISLETS